MSATLPFVGRDREAALLRSALDSALGGQGGLALISGEAGIGKTTLAELVCDEARRNGALVLTGRCYDLTETAPFAPWIELFGAYPRDGDLPEIPHSVAHVESDENTTSQAALFARIHRFLSGVANERPLVLLLDDQHWADDASLDLLRFIARQSATLRLLILVTYRHDELAAAPHLGQILPLLEREARPLRLSLKPLASDDLWAIVRPRYQLDANDEARLTSYLHDRTEGNPFYAQELLRTLEDESVLRQIASQWILGDLGRVRTPVIVEQIVDRRLANLGDDDRQVMAVAAVLGHEISLALWSQVASTSQERLLGVLERASQARLMAETPDGIGARFVHALIRQVVYGHLAPSRRRILHQQAGTALAEAAMPNPDAVANHFRRSGDPQAIEWLVRAGERAEQAYSWRGAAERFEAALTMMSNGSTGSAERGWLLVRLARMRRYTEPQLGLERLEEAHEIAAAQDDRALAATVLWQMGLLNCLQGDIQRGITYMERGVEAFDTLQLTDVHQYQGSAQIASILPDAHHGRGTLAMWLSVVGRYSEAIEHAASYGDIETIVAEESGNYGDAYVTLGRAQAIQGNSAASHVAYTRARSAYRQARHPVQLARATIDELQVRIFAYETDNLLARERIEADAESAWKRGSDALPGDFAGAMRMPRQFIEGDWAEMTTTALALRAHGTSAMRADATYWLGPVARAQGDVDLAWELIEEWLPAGPATTPGNTVYRTAQGMQQLAAEMALESRDLPTAERWLEAGDRWLTWSKALIGRSANAVGWAAYHRATGDPNAARSQIETALQLANSPRQPFALIAAHRAAGALATSDEDVDQAAHHLDAALTLAEACAAPFEQALTLLSLAELDVARDDVFSAESRLSTAKNIFKSLGARPALARADGLTAKLDSRRPSVPDEAAEPSPLAMSAHDGQLLDGLSPRELDVLRLLPAGHTNQEIADILFLSPKTIENHIGRILAKTDLPNRAAAAAFAQRAGIA